MGWRGALRAIAAAQRASERESLRRQRELARLSKQQEKVAALYQAASEVEEFNSRLEQITSVHKDCGNNWDWAQLLLTTAPKEPQRLNTDETAARAKLDAYEPGFFDRLFRREKHKRQKLEGNIAAGRDSDLANYNAALRKFEAAHKDWAEMNDLSARIIAGDVKAYRDAAEELSPFRELSDLGSRITLIFTNAKSAEATLFVNSDSVVPSEQKTLLQSGKLSIKPMPQSRFNELYQDYVAGAVLRIARELFGLLPLDTVTVTAVANMLNTQSGYMEDTSILSAFVPRATLQKLNFESLDPSDALKNFNHRMEFKKSKGFSSVAPLISDAQS